jgi:hypothetical protein
MKRQGDTVVVGKNWLWGGWVLAMIALALPFSGWFLYLGLAPGRAGVGWMMVVSGLLGLVAFGGYGITLVRTLRSPWHLALSPSQLVLRTPAYDLCVPWEQVVGIAVDEVEGRPACVLAFDDAAAVAQGATFHRAPAPAGAVTSARRMQARMEDNLARRGYHLGIPGRILELGPEALARLFTQARTGELWQQTPPP